MRRLALAAALAAASILSTPAMAQTPAPAAPAAPAAVPGLAITDIVAWLTQVGAQPSAIQREGGQAYITVADGGLTWILLFYNCTNDVCGDVQFNAVFSNPGITAEMMNRWNNERRFVKAYFSMGSDGVPAATAQYDVILFPQLPASQLADHATIWSGLVHDFAVHVGFFAAPDATAAPAATPPAQ